MTCPHLPKYLDGSRSISKAVQPGLISCMVGSRCISTFLEASRSHRRRAIDNAECLDASRCISMDLDAAVAKP
eukprot:6400726-Alexandrium_andersonii.AAC.1